MSDTSTTTEIIDNDNDIPFKGNYDKSKLVSNWYNIIELKNYENKQLNYLEIGCSYGANIILFAHTYGKHQHSKLYCIDPYKDYITNLDKEEEFKTFNENVKNNNLEKKIILTRGKSNEEILKSYNYFYDIIFINGNPEPEFLLEDAVLAFRKLKSNGIMIFNDYFYNGFNSSKKAIDAFLNVYSSRCVFIATQNHQIFIRKTK
jgi:predicted O-methyltransferase YrrM